MILIILIICITHLLIIIVTIVVTILIILIIYRFVPTLLLQITFGSISEMSLPYQWITWAISFVLPTYICKTYPNGGALTAGPAVGVGSLVLPH